MVFDPNSYFKARAQPLEPSMYDQLSQALSQGFNAAQAPAQMKRQGMQDELKNKLLQEQVTQSELLTPQKRLEAQFAQKIQEMLSKGSNRNGQQNVAENNAGVPNQNVQTQQFQPEQPQEDFQSPNFDVSGLNQQFQNPEQSGQFQQPGQAGEGGQPGEQVLAQGNPSLSDLDRQYMDNPMLRSKMDGIFNSGIKERYNDRTGELIVETTLPSGKKTVQIHPLSRSPEDIATKTEEGKLDVKHMDEVADNLDGLEANQTNIDYALDLIDKNPNAMNVIGPYNSVVSKYFGDQADQDLLGTLATTSGDIMLNTAKNLKGAWTGRDQSMVNNIKFNNNDPFGVYVGKIRAMKVLNEYAQQKLDYYTKLRKQGLSRTAARARVKKDIKLEPIQKQVDDILKNVKGRQQSAAGNQQNNIPVNKTQTVNGQKYTWEGGKWFKN